MIEPLPSLDDLSFLDVLPFTQHVLKGSLHVLDDKKSVQRAVSVVSMPWGLATSRILADVSSQMKGASREDLAARVVSLGAVAWKRIMSQSADKFDRILDDALRHALTDVQPVATERTVSMRRKLRIIAAGWFKGWGETLIERRLVPLLAEKLAALPASAKNGNVADAVRESLAVVPRAMGDLMQPLVRTLISLGILAAQEEGGGKEASRDLKPLLRPPIHQVLPMRVVPPRSKPERVTKQTALIYSINPLPDACPICVEIARRGPFSTWRALERIDELAEMAGTEDIVNGLVDSSSFVELEDVKGKSRDELERQGIMVPPFHFSCFTEENNVYAEWMRCLMVRSYQGPISVVKVRDHGELICTPNHPISTPSGKIAAGCLAPGNFVWGCSRNEWDSRSRCANEAKMPASFKDLADAVQEVPAISVKAKMASRFDFHGDGGSGSDMTFTYSGHGLSELDSLFRRIDSSTNRFSPKMKACEVESVDRQESWRGTVYNAETATGQYLINGIQVSNCRCGISLG
jgi:hypothetical protein